MPPCGLRHLARAEPTRHTIDKPVTERANGATGESNGRAEAERQPEGEYNDRSLGQCRDPERKVLIEEAPPEALMLIGISRDAQIDLEADDV